MYPFVRDKVRLELGGESTLVTQVRAVTTVGHYVLFHRVLGGERTLTNVTLKRSKPRVYFDMGQGVVSCFESLVTEITGVRTVLSVLSAM